MNMNTTQSQTKCETMKRERMKGVNTNVTQSQNKCEMIMHAIYEDNTITSETQSDGMCTERLTTIMKPKPKP